jgi:hypothetical protein
MVCNGIQPDCDISATVTNWSHRGKYATVVFLQQNFDCASFRVLRLRFEKIWPLVVLIVWRFSALVINRLAKGANNVNPYFCFF